MSVAEISGPATSMQWLNYHHLLYFWTVARTGSVTEACDELKLAQPTISGQIRALEEELGESLFVRAGRGIILTEFGKQVFRYADEIFGLGRELMDFASGRTVEHPIRLAVGIADVVPKLVAFRLLEPALELPGPVRLVCTEDRTERLIGELAIHGLDLVISDAPVRSLPSVRAYSHLLGECGVSFFARPELAQRHRSGFPGSLDGAPMLLPTENTSLGRSLNQWFGANDIRPKVVSEFQDSALLKVFGQAGIGIFPASSAIASEICEQHGVTMLGQIDELREAYYAISLERRLKHPAIVAISEAARHEMFARGARRVKRQPAREAPHRQTAPPQGRALAAVVRGDSSIFPMSRPELSICRCPRSCVARKRGGWLREATPAEHLVAGLPPERIRKEGEW
jgi:LysR family transcriptional regulator, transcriptional activator of nhaA